MPHVLNPSLWARFEDVSFSVSKLSMLISEVATHPSSSSFCPFGGDHA